MTQLANAEWNKGTDRVRLIKAAAAYNMGSTALVGVLNNLVNQGVDIYSNEEWVYNLPKDVRVYVDKIFKGDPAYNQALKKSRDDLKVLDMYPKAGPRTVRKPTR